MKETHIGAMLASLRKGKMSQAVLASKMQVDQSWVSRIETDPKPAPDDAMKYLAAFEGDSSAKEFSEYLNSEWPNLKELGKPPYLHPCRLELTKAENAIAKLRAFVSDPSSPPDLINQAIQ